MGERRSALLSLGLLSLLAACSRAEAPVAAPPPTAPATVTLPPPAAASPATGFHAFLQKVRADALAADVRPQTLDAVLPYLVYDQRVVDLDRSQPDDGGPTAAPPPLAAYLARRLDAYRIDGGRSRIARLQPQLLAFESRFGVPGAILLGIWGMETNYGSYTGNFDIFRSLASLAYDGRRRVLFTGELIAALQIVDRGMAQRSALTGSWAGAMGNPQFLPSSYLKMAVDGDGDGRADIWNSEADTLASIANYLARNGWKRGEPWGIEVQVPSGLNRAALVSTAPPAPSCTKALARHSGPKTVAEWRALGLLPIGKPWSADTMSATLIEADGPSGRAFLTFDSYRALLNYNCSNYYAISVGLLADAISR